jgi:uncharacterized protein DUF6602
MTSKSRSNQDGTKFLQEAFALEQQVLQVKLELSSKSITHAGVSGAVNESHFIHVLRKYFPKRYAVDTGIVIDSTGKTSDQIDVVIYDQQYTPTLLDQENHRFIPSEAVYGVLEVKPTLNKAYLEYSGNKAKSVRSLLRTSAPIYHAGGKYSAKPIFPIIAGIVAANCDWVGGFESAAFKKAHNGLAEDRKIDCGLAVSSNLSFDYYDEKQTVSPNGQALIYFIFRLLNKLQTLGTVPAIDWNAYAKTIGRDRRAKKLN